MQNERDLWAAVLGVAFEDLGDTAMGDRTRLWFESDDYEPGSFLWICDHLGLDVSATRRAALEPGTARPGAPLPERAPEVGAAVGD
jgi:hypothetical protein